MNVKPPAPAPHTDSRFPSKLNISFHLGQTCVHDATSVWLRCNEKVRFKSLHVWQFSAEESNPNFAIERNTSCSSCYHHRQSLHFFNFRLYFIILIVGLRNTTFITTQWYHTALNLTWHKVYIKQSRANMLTSREFLLTRQTDNYSDT